MPSVNGDVSETDRKRTELRTQCFPPDTASNASFFLFWRLGRVITMADTNINYEVKKITVINWILFYFISIIQIVERKKVAFLYKTLNLPPLGLCRPERSHHSIPQPHPRL
jgi:hypothetical protein